MPKESVTTIEEVRANLEAQLKAIDSKVEKAVQKVDKLTKQRAELATLLEKVNRVNVSA
jgi:peptidoglycan hydrolase CwlO-like protein